MIERHPPPAQAGRAIRLYYIAQMRTRPPTFAIVTNQPDRIHWSYERYVSKSAPQTFQVLRDAAPNPIPHEKEEVTVRALWNTGPGDARVLEIREGRDPEPKPGEVCISVRVAGLNFADILARQGLYQDAPKFPCVLGYEGAGVVVGLGEGVTSVRPGQRVMFCSRFGAQAIACACPKGSWRRSSRA